MSKLEKKDLFWAMLKGWCYQPFSFNYETMQSPGWVHAIGPILEKVYGDDPELLKEKLRKHFVFYNTQPWMSQLILGSCVAIEESQEPECTETAIGLRTGLMGPFAGLGDSLFFITGKVILSSIAGYMALNGSLFGMVIILAVMVGISYLKYKFFYLGYQQGAKFITDQRANLEMLTASAIIIGFVVVGAMIPSMVSVATPLTFQVGDVTIVVQEMLNTILPGLLPVVVTGLIYYGLALKGMTTVRMVWLIIVVAIALSCIGII
ncbi:MAG: PTS system mannose/fructose/sorbose family transporter subunit IID [Erysipelotrichaceae bacterium]|jgi:PTS system mannose-specific IID component|nr:PTS system mannose/fructose/sorbose family transporter subunit IID [Erysipelotrichaceae bacterium]